MSYPSLPTSDDEGAWLSLIEATQGTLHKRGRRRYAAET
jgi:hypothetical protein